MPDNEDALLSPSPSRCVELPHTFEEGDAEKMAYKYAALETAYANLVRKQDYAAELHEVELARVRKAMSQKLEEADRHISVLEAEMMSLREELRCTRAEHKPGPAMKRLVARISELEGKSNPLG
eukprot:TRINITY_DN5056_c0_g1_i1.p1 TRINITY_DN5056_c0_g1~~TRINITY_DN5056_c0_g1_i1.p1  ORF type:complete len:124 (+),score=20.41 TRINITY_DN5056_c0_g1_i1:63-434(+)